MYINLTQFQNMHTLEWYRRLAGPDGSFVSTGACNLGVLGSNPDRDGYLSS